MKTDTDIYTDDLSSACARYAPTVAAAAAVRTATRYAAAVRTATGYTTPPAAAAYITAGKAFDAASAALEAARAAYEDACLDLVEAGKAFAETSGGYSQGIRQ